MDSFSSCPQGATSPIPLSQGGRFSSLLASGLHWAALETEQRSEGRVCSMCLLYERPQRPLSRWVLATEAMVIVNTDIFMTEFCSPERHVDEGVSRLS